MIITIAFMNFHIDLSRVALLSYPLIRPPEEQNNHETPTTA
ncbi:hypothetical protein EMIT0196MI5_60172 [Pseudomonas sp. IT-196MI5]